MKHTPGPWFAIKPHYRYLIETKQFGTIAWLSEDTQSEANAQLIAAAPDLLEASKEALAYVIFAEKQLGENKSGAMIVIKKLTQAITITEAGG